MTELLIENYISIEYSLIEEDCIQCLKDIENYIRLFKDIEDTIMNLEMEEFEMEFFNNKVIQTTNIMTMITREQYLKANKQRRLTLLKKYNITEEEILNKVVNRK